MEGIATLLNSTFAVIAGNITGALANRMASLVSQRAIKIPDFSPVSQSVLDEMVSLFLHIGFITMGTHVASSAIPAIMKDAPSFTLYMLGIWSSSPNMVSGLQRLNRLVLSSAESPAPVPVVAVEPKESPAPSSSL